MFVHAGLQIYGGPRSLSHDFKIWPITFQGSGPSGPILFSSGLQIYGRPGSLSHGFKIWPITFQGSGPNGPIPFSCEKISL